ncbi:hypothetical protein LI90_3339 [Carbonactinospora thermoautotrophica]|uniref:Uncharacterized protein n=1 Tax=Carbonactinospora thermoautotrophica TaxID=1469144 RepID=A0A132MX28_9ACTN|nr:hypothetical protein [Carbonactinospora thermoautotrophica]KWX02296.1 hypothetical protein LI90_3339 [Carbonactinospora thermoautotrophica]
MPNCARCRARGRRRNAWSGSSWPRGIPWEPEFDDITEEEIRAADGRITL